MVLFLGEGNGTPLQYSCLENFMERGTWRATVHGVVQRKSPHLLLNEHTVLGEFSGLCQSLSTLGKVKAAKLRAVSGINREEKEWVSDLQAGVHT